MVSFSANILAFYLGAICLERSGIICGAAVFLATALIGTIMASSAEKCLASMATRTVSCCSDRIVRYSMDRLYFGW